MSASRACAWECRNWDRVTSQSASRLTEARPGTLASFRWAYVAHHRTASTCSWRGSVHDLEYGGGSPQADEGVAGPARSGGEDNGLGQPAAVEERGEANDRACGHLMTCGERHLAPFGQPSHDFQPIARRTWSIARYITSSRWRMPVGMLHSRTRVRGIFPKFGASSRPRWASHLSGDHATAIADSDRGSRGGAPTRSFTEQPLSRSKCSAFRWGDSGNSLTADENQRLKTGSSAGTMSTYNVPETPVR